MFRKIIYLSIITFILSSCGMKNKTDLTNNYEENTLEINELKEFFNNIVPENYIVRIRYDSSQNVDLFVYEQTLDSLDNETLFEEWSVNLENYIEKQQTADEKKYGGKTKSLDVVKQKLNWTDETFEILYDKLEGVNCMGITNGNPTQIEFGYNGMGVFSYLIFDKNLDTELQEKYSDDCFQMFYRDNIVFEYGSGAVGSLCTEEFKKK